MVGVAHAQTTPSAPHLTAAAGNSQVTLSCNQTAYPQNANQTVSYNIYRGTSAGGEGAAVYATMSTPSDSETPVSYTDTAVTNGTAYYYQVVAAITTSSGGGFPTSLYISVQQSPSSNEASATPIAPVALAAPTALTAVSTGSGKITLYWSGVANANGYNVYRSTAASGEDYAHPVNGATPVTTQDTGPGVTNTFMYSDVGLTNGTEYFYTVEAVNGSSQSAPSNEDSDIVDPNAVPWISINPNDILNAVRSAYAGGSNPVQGSLRVAGPDGQIYEDGQSQVLPPDGQLIAGTNQFVLSNGDQITLNNDTSSSANFQASASPQVATTLGNSHSGPYRRMRTSPSYTGGIGYFYLPPSGYRGIGANSDGLYLLLGGNSNSGANSVDASLLFMISQKTGLPTGWRLYLRTSPPSKVIVCFPKGSNVFSDDQYVIVGYSARPENASRGSKGIPCLVQTQTLDGTQSQSLAAYVGYKYNESVVVKRTISIAQNSADPTVNQVGYKKTLSYLTGVSWSQGQLLLPNGGTTAWSRSTSPEDGSFPAKGGIVNWFETSPYVAEDNVAVDLR